MPVSKELLPFFKNLVEKSKKGEINWKAAGERDSFRVDFPDMAITVSQAADKPLVRIQLLNDESAVVADIMIDDDDDEWLGAVGLVNSANRKVMKKDVTMRRAMEELSKDGPIGAE